MKKIGLVGGTGPESTVLYYKELNTKIDEASGGKNMPELSIESVNFRKVWEWVSSGQQEALVEYLSEKVNCLVKGGAEIITLTAVTMHLVIDEIESNTKVSLVSIPKAVSEEAVERGYKKVGLLGTIFTMEQDFMKKDLRDSGIDVIVPDEAERKLIARKIFEELEFGIVKESTLREFNAIIRRMQVEQGIEAVVLGCTELPLLLKDENCPLPCLDSIEIHIKKLVNMAL